MFEIWHADMSREAHVVVKDSVGNGRQLTCLFNKLNLKPCKHQCHFYNLSSIDIWPEALHEFSLSKEIIEMYFHHVTVVKTVKRLGTLSIRVSVVTAHSHGFNLLGLVVIELMNELIRWSFVRRHSERLTQLCFCDTLTLVLYLQLCCFYLWNCLHNF